jgi:formamidopyrimidine-DNA glycosylase
MPEGPECRLITEKLRNRVKGKYLIDMELSCNVGKYQSLHFPALPLELIDIVCKGKSIFFFLSNNISFHSTLALEGHWYYFDINSPKNLSYLSNKNYKVLSLKIGIKWGDFEIVDTELVYDDKLHYGNFNILTWQESFSKMEVLGPDLLVNLCPFEKIDHRLYESISPSFFQYPDEDYFTEVIKNPKLRKLEICKFLFEQKYFSGIGNYLKSEILYAARVLPYRLLGSLSDEEIHWVFYFSTRIIYESYLSNGMTHGTFLDPDMVRGRYTAKVYKRENQYDNNGFLIKKIKTSDKRSSYIVPELQQ